MKLPFIFFITIFLGFNSTFLVDTPEKIKTILDERDRQIKELLGPEGSEYSEQKREELKSIINDIVDYPEMAKVALDTHFEKISQVQREEFIDLFSRVIRQHSLGQLDIYRAQIAYNSIEVDGKKAEVVTMATLESVRTPVKYRMHKKGDQWLIADMAVDDVWTAESYRRSFQNIIRRRGFDALLDSLRRRVEE